MKRFPKYKESGAPWLGQVPAHWGVKRLKRVFYETAEKARPGDEQLAATQKYGVISQSQFMKAEDQKLVLALKGTDNFKHVEQDDFVISLRAFEGGIERSSQSGCVSPAYTVLRSAGQLSAGYSARLLKTPAFISQISMTYDGIREGKAIKFKDAGPVLLPIPPAEEQAAITNFIDRSVGQMDTVISSQGRMIELLKERRSAIITQAVTKGLDPMAKMKDSGVPLLGQVPAHWEVKPLKFVAKYNLNTLPETIEPSTEISYIEVSDVSQELGIKSFECMRFADAPSRARRVVAKGEVIISTVRTYLKAIARVDHVHDQFVCSTGFCVVRPDSVMADFAQYALASDFFMAEVISRSTGVSYPAINASDLVRVRIAVPPVDEQAKISGYLARAVAELDSAINSQVKMIELLKERRSAIITQAVTGQIDIR